MRVHLNKKPAMVVHRRILKKNKLVYLLVGPSHFKYDRGRSRIVYIGTTKRGAKRIASSAAHRAEEILANRGFQKMDTHIVSCGAKPGLKSWIYLEQALLAGFLACYGQLPMCNKQGKKLRYTDELDQMFRFKVIHRILMKFDARG